MLTPRKINEIPIPELIGYMTDEQKKAIIATLGKPEGEQVNAINLVIADNEKLAKEVDALKKQLTDFEKQITEKKLPETTAKASDFGFKNFADFAQQVYRADTGKGISADLVKHQDFAKERRQKAAGDGMQIWDDSEGGFAVPDQFIPRLLQFDPNILNLAGRATAVTMTSPIARVPSIVSTSHATSIYGGIISYFKSEEAALAESKPAFGEVVLTANKLTTLCYVTDEMMTFSPISVASLLEPLFQRAIQWKLDQKIVAGNGVGEPRGLINSACKVSVSRDTASHVMGADFANMWARVPMNLRGDAIWLVSPAALPDIMNASIVTGTGGQLIYMPPQGMSTAPYGTIYGKPVLETEHCSVLGTAGDVMLVNMKEYLFGQASSYSGTGFVVSIHLKFDYAQTAFRIILYVDGQCWWSNYLTLSDAATTQSPVVVLT